MGRFTGFGHWCDCCSRVYVTGNFSNCYLCNMKSKAKHRQRIRDTDEKMHKMKCEDMEFDIELATDALNKSNEFNKVERTKYIDVKKDMDKLRFINYLHKVYNA